MHRTAHKALSGFYSRLCVRGDINAAVEDTDAYKFLFPPLRERRCSVGYILIHTMVFLFPPLRERRSLIRVHMSVFAAFLFPPLRERR